MKDLKTVTIQYTDDYGGKGRKAWLISEFYNGEKTHQGFKVAKRDEYMRLHEICEDLIERGFTTIEIKKTENS